MPEESIDPYTVPEDIARDHAVAAIIEFIVAGPGSEEGEMWRNATVGSGSVLLYDLNNRPFVYHFPVESGDAEIGGIKVAARKILGASVLWYETTPAGSPGNLPDEIPNAIDVAEERYPGSIIQSAVPCYAPPVTGILVGIESEDGAEKGLLVDPERGSVVRERDLGGNETAVVDHLGNVLSEDEIERRIETWNTTSQNYSDIFEFAEEHGIDTEQPLSNEDFSRYARYFESPAPVPSPPAEPEPEETGSNQDLEEWQSSAEWNMAAAFEAGMPEEEIAAVIETYLPEAARVEVREKPRNFWIYLTSTNAEFGAYKADLENHPDVHVCGDEDAFFVDILENPKTRGDYTLWAIDISQNPVGVDQNDLFEQLVREGFPLETMKIVDIQAQFQDDEEKEEAARQLNEDERVLFVMKEFLLC
ncbi:MAG TPA: hypothetical protein ENN85_09560 [Methanoculleus sp.]|nr:hypothetical protein [Methanoculleus sp.]